MYAGRAYAIASGRGALMGEFMLWLRLLAVCMALGVAAFFTVFVLVVIGSVGVAMFCRLGVSVLGYWGL